MTRPDELNSTAHLAHPERYAQIRLEQSVILLRSRVTRLELELSRVKACNYCGAPVVETPPPEGVAREGTGTSAASPKGVPPQTGAEPEIFQEIPEF